MSPDDPMRRCPGCGGLVRVEGPYPLHDSRREFVRLVRHLHRGENCPHSGREMYQDRSPSPNDPYRECSIYLQHGACSCSTGVPGNVCPMQSPVRTLLPSPSGRPDGGA
jgi:hypothetical protein